jgi:hypothetical protein
MPQPPQPVPERPPAPEDETTGPALSSAPQDGRTESRVSDDIQRWLEGDGDKTLGGLMDVFGPKSFAILFVLLLGVPALPLPTGGATHVFEIIAVLLALQLIANRKEIWLPQKWRRIEFGGGKQERFVSGLMKLIRWLERFSKPRLSFLFDHRVSNICFGVLVIAGSVAAFVAPPFTGLDTLPSLGVVLLSLGVLLEDIVVVAIALIVGAVGVVLEIVLGTTAVKGIGSIF